MSWDEGKVARILARNTFKDALCVLPNTQWTGDEIDLLVVPQCLRVVDVEIKISRADLRADRDKDRWWRRHGVWRLPAGVGPPKPDEKIDYPRHVWKHYYAMPVDIWKTELLDSIWPTSGVLLVSESENGRVSSVECVQRAVPSRTAKPLGANQIREIARLASLRMWDAYRDAERARADHAKQIALYAGQHA